MNRRFFLSQSLGAIALSALEAANDKLPHFAPKAKRVIFLTQ